MADQNEIEVKITGTMGDLDNDITHVETKVKNAAKGMRESANIIKSAFNDIKNTLKNIDFKVHVDTAALQTTMQSVINTVKTQVQAAGNAASIKIKVDTNELASIRNQISSGLSGNNGTIKIKFDRSHLQTELAQIRAQINSFFATSVNGIRLNISVTQADLAAVRAKLRSLTTTIFKAKVGIDLAHLNAQIAHARAMLGAIGSSLNINVDATATGLITAINNLKAEIIRLIAAMNSGGGGGGGSGGSGGFGAIFGGNLAAMATGFITSQLAQLSKALITTSDDAALLNSRMLDLLGTEQAVVEVKDRLYTAAQRLQVGYQDMAASTARMIPSLQEMGKGSEDAVKLAEILMTTAKLSGASTMEAASSAQQFGQALGSGVLAGDELKSILENNQSLARSLANALKLPDASTKVTLGMLKELGSEGKITSEVLANALLNSYDSIMAKADKLPTTFSGVWQQVKNIFFKTVDDLNQADVFGGLKDSLKDMVSKLEQFSKDGTLKEWATDIGGVLSEAGSLFMELVGIVGDVVSEISTLWQDLAGSIDESTGAQIGFFELLKNSLKVVHVFFIGLRTGIQLVMAGIKAIVQDAVATIIASFVLFRTGINTAVIAVSGFVEGLIVLLKTLASVAMKALQLDFSGAISAWESGTNKIAGIVKDKAQQIAKETRSMKSDLSAAAGGSALLNGSFVNNANKITQDSRQRIDDVLLGDVSMKSPKASTAGAGGNSAVDKVAVGAGKPKKEKKPKAEKSQMSDLGQGLEAQKTEWENQQNAAGTLQEFPLERVREYWQNVLATKKLSADDQLKVEKNLADANHAIRQRNLSDEITAKRQELQDYSQNVSAKLVKAQAYAERLKAIYGEQSSEYKQALQEQNQLEEDVKQKAYQQSLRDSEHNQQLKLNEVEAAELQMQHEYDLGLMSDKKRLEALRIFEQQRYEITQAGIKDRIALYDTENERTSGKLSPDDRLKMVDQKNDSDTDHTKNQKGFDMQSEAQKMESMFGGLGDRVSNLWDQGLQSMMDGTLTWRGAMNAVFADMGAFFVQKMVSEPLKHYMASLARRLLLKLGVINTEVAAESAGQAAQTGATVVGEATRTSATAAGGLLRIGLKAMEAIKGVMLSAWEAMAGAWAAMVQIPIVGPIIAPVVAAGTFAGVAALAGKIKSASGGYDIPAGVNPVTQLHEEEMVLPKPYANVIRDMASGGVPAAGGSGAMGGTVEQNQFNISALDAKSLKKLLRQNPRAVAGGLKAYSRNFGGR